MTDAGDDPDDGADSGGDAPADGDAGDAAAPDRPGAEFPCPECGEALPEGARFCPHCATPIGEDEEAVDLSELDGRFSEDQPALLRERGGERRASGRVMVVAGLAVAVPLAPLGLFLVSTVASLTVWTAALVFLGAWLAPAAYLARARVPAEAFARSLYLIAVGAALIPVGLRVGSRGIAGADLELPFPTVATVAIIVAGLALVLARFVQEQASARVTGDRRAFEKARADPEDGEDG